MVKLENTNVRKISHSKGFVTVWLLLRGSEGFTWKVWRKHSQLISPG